MKSETTIMGVKVRSQPHLSQPNPTTGTVSTARPCRDTAPAQPVRLRTVDRGAERAACTRTHEKRLSTQRSASESKRAAQTECTRATPAEKAAPRQRPYLLYRTCTASEP